MGEPPVEFLGQIDLQAPPDLGQQPLFPAHDVDREGQCQEKGGQTGHDPGGDLNDLGEQLADRLGQISQILVCHCDHAAQIDLA